MTPSEIAVVKELVEAVKDYMKFNRFEENLRLRIARSSAESLLAQEEGKKLRFTGCSDFDSSRNMGADPRKYLTIGEVYEVSRKEVFDNHARIFLTNLWDVWFDHDFFEEV
jgi:hypothetical protein